MTEPKVTLPTFPPLPEGQWEIVWDAPRLGDRVTWGELSAWPEWPLILGMSANTLEKGCWCARRVTPKQERWLWKQGLAYKGHRIELRIVCSHNTDEAQLNANVTPSKFAEILQDYLDAGWRISTAETVKEFDREVAGESC